MWSCPVISILNVLSHSTVFHLLQRLHSETLICFEISSNVDYKANPCFFCMIDVHNRALHNSSVFHPAEATPKILYF